MKRFLLIVLSLLLIFCFCSCGSSHRKIVFSDGTEICFSGICYIEDTYISYDDDFVFGTKYCVSIDGRSYQIIDCSCDVLED